GYELVRVVKERFPDLIVTIENDVNLAAFGERWLGSGRDHSNLIFFSFRTGIGAGIILDGQLYRGASGIAGEAGFLAFDAEFNHRDHGGHGHLESLAGGVSLLSAAGRMSEKGA